MLALMLSGRLETAATTRPADSSPK
jgi:hypothetical protein